MTKSHFDLRDYQLEAIEAVWRALFDKDNALLVLPTGAGKTLTIAGFCEKVYKAKPDARVLFLVNKVSLATQTAKVFSGLIDGVGVFCGSLNSYSQERFTVASIQSLVRADLDNYHLVIVDEAHRLDQREGSQYMKVYSKLLSVNKKLKIVGLTATPFRNDGYIYGPDKIFDSITYCKDVKWAIDQGWLVRPFMKHTKERFLTTGLHTRMGDFDSREVRNLTVDRPKVQRQIDDAMPQLEGRNKIIWHCSCIEHAELVAETIPEEAIVIHSKMNIKERKKQLSKFEDGNVRHLVFVMIVSEGYDFPPISAVVLMRPTKSPLLYIQCVGRALRTSLGKKDCLVLDYGEVVANCGPLDDPIVREKGSGTKVKPIPMKFCPSCLEYLKSSTMECHACGHKFKVERDYMSGLSDKSGVAAVLSSDKPRFEWIEVNPERSNVSVYESRSGNMCLKFTFRPKNYLNLRTFNKFVVIKSDNSFVDRRAPQNVHQVVGEIVSAVTPEEYEREIIQQHMLSRIKKIKVDHRGKYPQIVEFVRDEQFNVSRA
jgi:DNA repair protein RadD